MFLRLIITLLLLQSPLVIAQDRVPSKPAMREVVEFPTRSVRRDIPLTNSILKAMKAGTRDFSGKPGPNYWQLKTDYTISARLLPETQTIYGTERIVLHNNSPDELDEILLRLDHNIYRPFVPRGYSIPAETTAGMIITSLSVNGVEVDLAARPVEQRFGEEPR